MFFIKQNSFLQAPILISIFKEKVLRNHRIKFNAKIQSLQVLSESFGWQGCKRKLTEGKAAKLAIGSVAKGHTSEVSKIS
jgi:hypothetical protein